MGTSSGRPRAAIERLDVAAYRIPTDHPESDGTFAWDSTPLVIVEAVAGGQRGLGYVYAEAAAAHLVRGVLAPVVTGADAFDISGAWVRMGAALRDVGRGSTAASALSAVDCALWDLKSRLLGLSLLDLLGATRAGITAYGSGGFASYPTERLQEQLATWAEQGLTHVKMKVGRAPDDDFARVSAARDAIGPDADLFADADGAYSRKQALGFAVAFADVGVTWFEEPVAADDLDGLRLLRDHAPADMEIAAGEYGDGPVYFRRLLDAGAVDVLQADATRCGGVNGFLQAAALAQAYSLEVSTRGAPALHRSLGCAAAAVRQVEYYHDHARIEALLFDGAASPTDGQLVPDRSRPGIGLQFKHADARPYLEWQG